MAEVRNDRATEPETVSVASSGPPPALADAVTLDAADTRLVRDERPSVPGYELHDELGRGGMGVVFKARQQSLNRFVALKMILAGPYAGADQRARFRVEAESVARLQHPGIVQIYEVGSHAGHSYLTLEFVSGGTLAKRLNGKPMTATEAARLIETLARAVQYAHQRGVVHRDLKPGNVLLSDDGQPKIADFGLAKLLDTEPGATAKGPNTQSGAILGTPAYMAPEQTGGKRGVVGPAADVYALGAILYELLTGRPPFQADSTVDLILKVASEEPRPPRQIQPSVPRDLEAVCLKCLRKDPGGRYASAGALADDLLHFLNGEPTVARPAPRGTRLRRWAWRRRGLLIGGSIVACLLLLLLVSLAINALALMWGTRTSGPSQDPGQPVATSEVAVPLVKNAKKDTPDFREQFAKTTSLNNMKALAIAMHNYAATFNQFPPAAMPTKDGKPGLSWRVAILPFMEQDELYRQFKLDEPWDSANNVKLLAKMPKMYGPPTKPSGWQANQTYYQVFTGAQTIFRPGKTLRLQEITDGTSNTLLIVEAFEAVPWTKPADLPYDAAQPLPQLGGIFRDGFQAVMADGRTGNYLPKDIDPVKLRALITPAGGEIVP
ncbi:MAG TPA: protein kinase [Gemmataceae bacterium]|nr:protein kinase [Gemmataceae bacterium]